MRPLAVVAGGAFALWLALPGFVNYDTAYALVWGGELAHGQLPQYEAVLAPTPHPLMTLLGLALAPLGGGAAGAAVALGFVSLATLGYVVYRLGSEWFGRAAGGLAAAIVLTCVAVLSAGARAYADIPYLVIVLGALLVETRRPHAGRPVLGLLALAGLLRPEAWLFAAAYAAYAARGQPRERALELWALAAAAPAAWLLSDLLITGHALHSFTWTRDAAARLERARGPAAVTGALPGKLAGVTGVPVLAGGAAGAILTWARNARPGRAAAPVLACALAACAALTAAGMPAVQRYVLLPATLLALLCAAAALGWRSFPGDRRLRRAWALGGAALIAVLLASAPGRLGSIADLRERLGDQAALRTDLDRLAAPSALTHGCTPIAVSNRRLVPLLALSLGRAPGDFTVAGPAPTARGYYVGPTSPAVQRTLLFASSDPPEPAAPPPAGYRLLERNRAWQLAGRC